MHTILFVLLCTMTFVRADSMEDVIRDARVQNEEADELSSDNFQRFIGDEAFNGRRRRSGKVEHSFSDNDEHRINAKNKNLHLHPKRKRHHMKKREHLGEAAKVEKRFKKHKRNRIGRKKIMEQIERPKLKDEEVEGPQQVSNDLTTCIVVTEKTTENSDLTTSTTESESTSMETSTIQSSSVTEEVETSTLETTTTNEENTETTTSSEGTTTLTPETTGILETTTLIPETTGILETTTLVPETNTVPTTSEPVLTTIPSSEEAVGDTKIFNVRLICKVGKPETESNLQKVYQCYFGSSNSVAFYMPSLQNSILTKKVGDSFPTIEPDKLGNGKPFDVVHEIVSGSTVLPGNNTWRLIEAEGVRTRIIEKTAHDKNKSKKRRRRTKKGYKRRLKKRRPNLQMGIKSAE